LLKATKQEQTMNSTQQNRRKDIGLGNTGSLSSGAWIARVHPPSTVELKIVPMDTSYRLSHTAPRDDGYSNPIDRLADSFGDDVYDHPEYYGSGECDEETMQQIQFVRGNPDALVTVYRAVPPGVKEVNPGDWVTLSRAYAEQHAMDDTDPAKDWPILAHQVPASSVFTDGNDLAEYGYDGPVLSAARTGGAIRHVDAAFVEQATQGKDDFAEAATRAILAGSARAELAERFESAHIDIPTLAARVGHSERVARRMVAGKENLNESNLTAYFRALG